MIFISIIFGYATINFLNLSQGNLKSANNIDDFLRDKDEVLNWIFT